MLNLLRKSAERKQIARTLYDQLVERARAPVFFAGFGVADTIDGRFDMLALHAWLVLARLKGEGPAAQDLTDLIFIGFDEALREQGAGDIGIGHRIRKMADAFYGRLAAYDGAADEEALAAALARNLWRGGAVDGRARRLASYVKSARQHLESSAVEAGQPGFGPLPDLSGSII